MKEIFVTDGDQKVKIRYETRVWQQSKISGNICHGLVRLKLPATSFHQHEQWVMRFFTRNRVSILHLLKVYYRHEKFSLGTEDRPGFIFLFGRRHFLHYSSTISQLDLSWPICRLNQRYHLLPDALDLNSIDATKRSIYQLLIKQKKGYFVNRVLFLADKMNLDVSNLRIEVKIFKSHWGKFCSNGSKKVIRFNIWLLHFSAKTIDYVVIHELTHLAYPHANHGQYRFDRFPNDDNICLLCAKAKGRSQPNQDSLFWSCVRRYCPDFIRHIHLLNHVAGVG